MAEGEGEEEAGAVGQEEQGDEQAAGAEAGTGGGGRLEGEERKAEQAARNEAGAGGSVKGEQGGEF